MPLPPALARWLVEQGHDAIHAMELGLHRAPDAEIMQCARQQRRAIITADLDYPRLLALDVLPGPSLILFRGGSWSDQDIISRLGQVLPTLGPVESKPVIVVIERHRVRRRRLPVER
jgi:predicted nuclease of predicted toxin-antitoxin system